MTTLYLILLLLAAVCFFISAFITTKPRPWINLPYLGLFLWILVPLVSTFQTLTKQ